MTRAIGRTNRMEQLIGWLAASASNVVVFIVTSGIAFVLFVVLWALFGWGLIWSHGSIDAAWQWIGDLPIVIQAVVWLLFLPVVVGLWVWDTTWPLVLRLVVIAGLAGWSVLIFLPRALFARR